MKNALTYMTRACPRHCDYCDIATSKPIKNELNATEWKEAFNILHNMGVDFNLILGNEAWLLGDDLIDIMNQNQVPFAMYTTAPVTLFYNFKHRFFSGPIDNLSCGIDYSYKYLAEKKVSGDWMNDMEKKSYDGWHALMHTKAYYPHVDTQGNITIHRQNIDQLETIVQELFDFKVFTGINFIHWNSDGQFDFFPEKRELRSLTFKWWDYPKLVHTFKRILSKTHSIQHPEILPTTYRDVHMVSNMRWHCKGDPYGGPTIDADGSLRCCGYRKGDEAPKFSVFDLLTDEAHWKEAVRYDALNCPGCSWSYPRMYEYWKRAPDFAKKVFTNHAGKHIPEELWSKRMVE